MRLTRVYVADELQAPGRASLGGAAAAHVARVLRLRPGDVVQLFNGDGWEFTGTVAALKGDRVEVELSARSEGRPESPLALTLVQGVARGERMDLVVQKATELGVQRIVPVLAERSVVRLDGSQAARKRAHWQAVAIAACEQSGRCRLPRIDVPLSLAAWLETDPGPGLRLQLAPAAPVPLARLDVLPVAAGLLIGPEGGLSDAEQAAAVRAGYEPRSLGPRVLRTETAALAGIVLLQSIAGDLAAGPPGAAGRRPID